MCCDVCVLVPRGGFEPPTCPLGGDRAIHCATGARVGHLVHFLELEKIVINSGNNE